MSLLLAVVVPACGGIALLSYRATWAGVLWGAAAVLAIAAVSVISDALNN